MEEILVAGIIIIGVWLAFWVYFSDRKERLNQWFALMTFFDILWVAFSFLAYSASNGHSALLFYRLNWASVALFSIAFFYFYVIYFLKQTGKYKILGNIIVFLGVTFASLSLFTDLIIKDIIAKDWGFEIVFGSGNDFFSFYTLITALVVVILLIKRYFKLPVIQKNKIEYFLIGTFLFVIFNIIFNIIMPLATNTVVYQHYGDYSAIFLLGFTAYAIVRQNLFGIKIVLTGLLVSFISILLTIDIFLFTESHVLQFFKGIALIVFLYLGRELVKSVLKEEERSKQLEKVSWNLTSANQKLQDLLSMKNDFFSFYTLITALVVVILLIKRYFKLPVIQKNKIEYFLI
ncbi:MAG: hypothetical protein Q8M92_06365, partial [Candidatus Subteraquimicrobiales bacterium]|nr:hypothetical protein [Candidatus Subteraquimicrobiales bacterium]